MKNVATYKNKIIGVCALAFAVFVFPNLVGAYQIYERTPSGSGTYSQVDFYYELDSGEFNSFKNDWESVSTDWDTCNIELEALTGGSSVSLVNLGTNYGDGIYTATALGDIDMVVGDVAFQCFDSDDEENTLGKIEIEESTGFALFTLAENTGGSGYYSGTFPSDSATKLTGNLVSFFSESNAMSVVLIFIAMILGFYVIKKVKEIIESGKFDKENEKKYEAHMRGEDVEENEFEGMTKSEIKKEKAHRRAEARYSWEKVNKKNVGYWEKVTGRNLRKFLPEDEK